MPGTGGPASGAMARAASAIEGALTRHGRRLDGGPLVLGVSGGPDSLALLKAAASIEPERRPALVVANFAHGIRPEHDARATELVARVAADLGCQMVQGAGDVRARAKEQHQSLEAAARSARYAFLAEAAAANGASVIGVAHTLDDQAETVLLRLTRGAGLRGAGAMREWSTRNAGGRVLRLLRPLLGVPRSDTLAVCHEAGLEPLQDPMNEDVAFARSRVRHHVMPALEQINPGVTQALARFAQVAADAHATLAQAAQRAVRGSEHRTPGRVTWPRDLLRGLDPTLFAVAAQGAWEYLHGAGAALSARHIEAAIALVAAPEGGECSLPGGARFTVEQHLCSLLDAPTAAGARPLPDVTVPLAIPGSSRLGPWVIETRFQRPGAADAESEDRFTVMLDAAALTYPVALRRRRPGDTMAPLGMQNQVRLQDLLVNTRIRRSLRDAIPVVETATGIAWVVGVRLADWARVTERTERVLVLKARRADWRAPEDFVL